MQVIRFNILMANIGDALTRFGKPGVAPGEATLSIDRVTETFFTVTSLNTTPRDMIRLYLICAHTIEYQS